MCATPRVCTTTSICDALDRQRRERALVLDLVDVGAGSAEQRGDVGERAGHVAHVDAQAREPARLAPCRAR